MRVMDWSSAGGLFPLHARGSDVQADAGGWDTLFVIGRTGSFTTVVPVLGGFAVTATTTTCPVIAPVPLMGNIRPSECQAQRTGEFRWRDRDLGGWD
jgi:hypothetical protein